MGIAKTFRALCYSTWPVSTRRAAAKAPGIPGSFHRDRAGSRQGLTVPIVREDTSMEGNWKQPARIA